MSIDLTLALECRYYWARARLGVSEPQRGTSAGKAEKPLTYHQRLLFSLSALRTNITHSPVLHLGGSQFAIRGPG
jgi:hypothetical protein